MTSTPPAHPAAYIRVASADGPDDPRVRQQRHRVLSAAAALGWPVPVVYTDAGVPGWGRPGSGLAAMAGAHPGRPARRHDHCGSGQGQPHPNDLAAFHALCHEHGVTWHTLTHGPVTPGTRPFLGGIA